MFTGPGEIWLAPEVCLSFQKSFKTSHLVTSDLLNNNKYDKVFFKEHNVFENDLLRNDLNVQIFNESWIVPGCWTYNLPLYGPQFSKILDLPMRGGLLLPVSVWRV